MSNKFGVLQACLLVLAPMAGSRLCAAEYPSFRDLFYTYAVAAGEDPRNLASGILAAQEELDLDHVLGNTLEPGSQTPSSRYRLTPEELSGMFSPHIYAKIEHPDQIFSERGPVTVVIMAGHLGEFLSRPMFGELLQDKPTTTSFGREFQRSLLRQPSRLRDDSMFQLKSLKEEKADLGDLIKAASIDDAMGRPLVKLILLHQPFGSLESTGANENRVKIYRRRLDKLFAMLDAPPENLYFLGYSQGIITAVGLVEEIKAMVEPPAWSQNLRGIISWAGAFYGCEMAEMANVPGTSVHYLVESAKELAALDDDWRKVPQNALTWGRVLANLGRWAAAPKEGAAGYKVSGTKRYTNEEIIHLVMKGVAQLGLDHPTENPANKLRRGKLLAKALVQSVSEMQLVNRLAWLRQHPLPADLKYFGVAATMPGPSYKDYVSPLTSHSWLGSSHPEFDVERQSYYAIINHLPGFINDGTVSVQRVNFWPEVLQNLNPVQPPIEAWPLALVVNHHAGMAADFFYENIGHDRNPFPRLPLLKAVAAFAQYQR